MTLPQAQELIKRGCDKAVADYKRPICVSICDAYGFTIAFARMDGAPIRSIDISRRKAVTAVRMGVPTQAFFERLQKENLQADYFGPDLCPLGGGVRSRTHRVRSSAASVSAALPRMKIT